MIMGDLKAATDLDIMKLVAMVHSSIEIVVTIIILLTVLCIRVGDFI
jgi:hypothetical protein